MSQLFRAKKGITYSAGGTPDILPQHDDSNVMEGYATFDPALSDSPEPSGIAKPIGTDDLLVAHTAQFPGPREFYHPMPMDNAHFPTAGFGSIRDNIDWEVGGVSGLVNVLPYSLGVVSSDLVENFALTGQQAIIRRQPNPASAGAVQTADFNALQSIAYAQAAASYFPGEASHGKCL
jgi:hypothetical protein